MTTTEFLKGCEDYFGRWQRITVRTAVMVYLDKRSPAYLDELWPLLRDGRTVAYGAPDIKAITDMHVEVSDILDLKAASKLQTMPTPKQLPGATAKPAPITWDEIKKWSPVEDSSGDRWLSHDEAGQAVDLMMKMLTAKNVTININIINGAKNVAIRDIVSYTERKGEPIHA